MNKIDKENYINRLAHKMCFFNIVLSDPKLTVKRNTLYNKFKFDKNRAKHIAGERIALTCKKDLLLTYAWVRLTTQFKKEFKRLCK